MLLLCGATQPKMRPWLVLALVAALALPFAFAHPAYVAEQYRIWIIKLQQLTSVEPGQWLYQADFATMLDTFGIALPHTVQTVIRLAAALGLPGAGVAHRALWQHRRLRRRGDAVRGLLHQPVRAA